MKRHLLHYTTVPCANEQNKQKLWRNIDIRSTPLHTLRNLSPVPPPRDRHPLTTTGIDVNNTLETNAQFNIIIGYVNLYLTKLIKYDKSCRALDAPLFQCLCVCFSERDKATCPLSFSKHTSVQLTDRTPLSRSKGHWRHFLHYS